VRLTEVIVGCPTFGTSGGGGGVVVVVGGGVDVVVVVVGGGGAAIGPTVADVAVEEPEEFDSVTATRGNRPTSLEVGVYEIDVAPAMLGQVPPPLVVQSCHW
jgi:hypothetical protein